MSEELIREAEDAAANMGVGTGMHRDLVLRLAAALTAAQAEGEESYDNGYAAGATDCDAVLTGMMNERIGKLAAQLDAERGKNFRRVVEGMSDETLKSLRHYWASDSMEPLRMALAQAAEES